MPQFDPDEYLAEVTDAANSAIVGFDFNAPLSGMPVYQPRPAIRAAQARNPMRQIPRGRILDLPLPQKAEAPQPADDFDPDAYLAEIAPPRARVLTPAPADDFDPDSYLAEIAGPAPAQPTAPAWQPMADTQRAQLGTMQAEAGLSADATRQAADDLKALYQPQLDAAKKAARREGYTVPELSPAYEALKAQLKAQQASIGAEASGFDAVKRDLIAQERAGITPPVERKPEFPDFMTWRQQEIDAGRMDPGGTMLPDWIDAMIPQAAGALAQQAGGVLRTFAPSSRTLGDIGTALSDYGAEAKGMAAQVPGASGSIGRGAGTVIGLTAGTPTLRVVAPSTLTTAAALGNANAVRAIQSTATIPMAERAAQEAAESVRAAGGDKAAQDAAAQHALVILPVYMAGGAAAARAGSRLAGPVAGPAMQTAVGTAASIAANVGTSAALAAIEGGEYGLENLTVDSLFGILHGVGVWKGAKAQTRADAADILISRGVDPFAQAIDRIPRNTRAPREQARPAEQPAAEQAPDDGFDPVDMAPEAKQVHEDAIRQARESADPSLITPPMDPAQADAEAAALESAMQRLAEPVQMGDTAGDAPNIGQKTGVNPDAAVEGDAGAVRAGADEAQRAAAIPAEPVGGNSDPKNPQAGSGTGGVQAEPVRPVEPDRPAFDAAQQAAAKARIDAKGWRAVREPLPAKPPRGFDKRRRVEVFDPEGNKVAEFQGIGTETAIWQAKTDLAREAGIAGPDPLRKGGWTRTLPPAPGGGDDVLSILMGKKIRSPKWYKDQGLPVPPEYDAIETIPLPWRTLLFSKDGVPLDEKAKDVNEWRSIGTGDEFGQFEHVQTGDDLIAEIDAAIKARNKTRADEKAQAAEIKVPTEQFARFQRDRVKQSKAAEQLTGDDLRVGDVLELRGEELRVTEIDPDNGDVTLSDGERYGQQLLSGNEVIYAKVKRRGNTAPETPADGGDSPFSRRGVADIEKLDRDYLDAVKRGDTAQAQRLVDEAAKAAGYNVGPVWHGTRRQFNEFIPSQPRGAIGNKPGIYFSPDRRTAEEYAMDADGATDSKSRVIQAYIRNAETNTSQLYGTTEYRVDNAEDVKSADPVTRNAQGNVIPLSQRFNEASPDIRFSRRGTPKLQRGQDQGDLLAGTDQDAFNLAGERGTDPWRLQAEKQAAERRAEEARLDAERRQRTMDLGEPAAPTAEQSPAVPQPPRIQPGRTQGDLGLEGRPTGAPKLQPGQRQGAFEFSRRNPAGETPENNPERFWQRVWQTVAPGPSRDIALELRDPSELVRLGIVKPEQLTGAETAVYLSRQRAIWLLDQGISGKLDNNPLLDVNHEAAHAWQEGYSPEVWAALERLWKAEVTNGEGPLFDEAGELRAGVNRDIVRSVREWAAERAAHTNLEWSRARAKAAEHDGSLIGKLAAGLRSTWAKVRLATTGERPDVITQGLREFLQRGDVAARDGAQFSRRNETRPEDVKENPLVAVHNLDERKLGNVLKMGGIAAPSLAVINARKSAFDSFGDITLIADKALIDPKMGVPVFDADVYSARYPTIRYDVARPAFDKMMRRFQAAIERSVYEIDGLDESTIEKDGVAALERSAAAQWAFLKERGIAVEPVLTPVPIPELAGFVGKDLWNPEFEQAAKDYLENENLKTARAGYPDAVREVNISRIDRVRRRMMDAGKIDRYATGAALEAEIAKPENRAAFKAWTEQFAPIVKREVFFSETASGNRKKNPHTLDNVVREMTRKIRDAEGFSYGVGNIRANVAKKFSSIPDMQGSRDRVIPSADMEPIKEQVKNRLLEIADEIAPFYKYEANRFGYLDAVAENMVELATKGRAQDFRPDAVPVMREFIDSLKTLPTEYFEAKLKRAVKLDEFRSAVVPDTISPASEAALQRAGLQVVKYKRGDAAAKQDAILKASDEVQFSTRGDKGKAERDQRILDAMKGKPGAPMPAPNAGRGDPFESVVPDAALPRASRVWRGVADVFDEVKGLGFLADAIRKHVDRQRMLQGKVTAPFRQWEQRHGRAERRKAEQEFEAYQRKLDQERDPDLVRDLNRGKIRQTGADTGGLSSDEYRRQASPAGRELIEAWDGIASRVQKRNQALNVMARGADGHWKPIGTVTQYYPRALRPDILRALRNPKGNRKAYAELARELYDAGLIKDAREAQQFIQTHFRTESQFDHLGNIEAARAVKMPTKLYDYTFAAARRYLMGWTERIAQIEAFGQKTTKTSKDLFDVAMDRMIGNEPVQEYIDAARKLAYSERSQTVWAKALRLMNTAAVGLQLGNPITVGVNLASGMAYNASHFGYANAMRGFWELRKLGQQINEAHEAGVLLDDLMGIAEDARDSGSKVADAAAAMTRGLLSVSGYNASETFVRAHGYATARAFLRQYLKDTGNGQFRRFFERNKLNADKLAAENGTGPETDKFLRRTINDAQGGYRYDQVPVFTDTPIGRFLFKYQKWGTQALRNFMINTSPLVGRAKDPAAWASAARYLLTTALVGWGIEGAKTALFGVSPRTAGLVEIAKTADEDEKRAWALATQKAWRSMMAAGAFGILGNYVQIATDVAERSRFKNPLDPPGLAAAKGAGELLMTAYEQGKLTSGDALDFLGKQVSLARVLKAGVARAVEAAGGTDNAPKVIQNETTRQNLSWSAGIVRRFLDEQGVEATRTQLGRVASSPLLPYKRAVVQAIHRGDLPGGREAIADYLSRLAPQDRKAAQRALESYVATKQPLKVDGSTSAMREAFIRWAQRRLDTGDFLRLMRMDQGYRTTAKQLGLMDTPKKPTEADLEKALQRRKMPR